MGFLSSSQLESSKVNRFLRETHQMINLCHSKHKDLACWSVDRSSFIIKNTKRLEKEIIPHFFNHNKFTSFSRQLHFYGFKKVGFSLNSMEFQHKYFMQDRPELLLLIKRSRTSDREFTTEMKQVERNIQSCEEKLDLISNDLQSSVKILKLKMQKKISKLESIIERQRNKRRQHIVQSSNKKTKKSPALIEDWERDFISIFFSKADDMVVSDEEVPGVKIDLDNDATGAKGKCTKMIHNQPRLKEKCPINSKKLDTKHRVTCSIDTKESVETESLIFFMDIFKEDRNNF